MRLIGSGEISVSTCLGILEANELGWWCCRIIRPWIEINPHFMRDLHVFHAVLAASDKAPFSAENAALLKRRVIPRLDFGASLVGGIRAGTKTITMRLLSDIEGDRNSDLGAIFPLSLVAATTSSKDGSATRQQFAYLRIDQVETQQLNAIDPATLRKSGFDSTDMVLNVLKQFYPNVTATTPLLMLHFHCLCSCYGAITSEEDMAATGFYTLENGAPELLQDLYKTADSVTPTTPVYLGDSRRDNHIEAQADPVEHKGIRVRDWVIGSNKTHITPIDTVDE
ncbi:unnamed protein product [Phytophthora fragariaefolia]|uniref:Unnamed protein product n=1 Tax=Phytophthora fragariaefolia TaxID=1490495 RepID=A0A9W6TSG9_9STRA|nr:unnamed protein product [Phytophthora fragariaefolia]